MGREAVDLWRQLDNKPMLAEALGGQAAQRLAAGEFEEAIAAGEESAALNRSIHNRFGLSITGSFTATAHEELGNMAAAIQGINEAIAIAEEIGLRSGLSWLAVVDLAAIYAFLGDFDGAVEHIEHAFATADPDLPARLSIAKAVLAKSVSSGDSPSRRQRCSRPTGS